jgi:Cutinase
MPRKSRIRLFLGFLVVAALVVGGLTGGALTTPASAAGTTAGGLFTPLQAYVLDTRHGVGGWPIAQFAAGHWYSVGIDGQGGVPTSNVAAVQVTFTAVNAAGSGVVHADQDGISNPNTTLPYATYGTTNISNTAVIPVGADGKIQVELTATADLLVNVQGYFTGGNAAGGGYVPVNATQIYNSGTTQYAAGASVSFPVAGQGGVPANASAVMLDVIEANGGSAAGYLTVYPAGSTKPSSSLNWPGGRNYEWTTAVPMNSTGNFTITVGAGSGSVSLSVGVEGYFTASDGTTAAGEFTGASARVFDSTSPSAPIASGASATIQVSGVAGLPAMGSGIAAVAANIEISPGSGAQGHVQVFADDSTPSQPTQQFYSGLSTFAFDVVSLGADGGITIQNSSSGTINVVIDVEGWYQAQALATPTISCPAPFSNGYASPSVPTSAVACTVSVNNGAYTTVNGSLDTYLDGVELTAVPFSGSGITTEAVSVSPQGGIHSISATADSSYGTTGATSTYGFTTPGPSTPIGFTADPWVTVPDPGDPGDPSATDFTPTLSATSSDVAAETMTFEVRSAEDSTAGSLIQTCTSSSVASGGTATCKVQPLAGGTYYVRSQATDGTYTSGWSGWSTLPVSSIVDAEILPPAVVTCPSIVNGQWDLTPPTSSFSCQITAPAAPSGSGSLNITLDGQGLGPVTLNTSATTTTTVTIPPGAAQHDIETTVQEVTNGPATDSDSFTFGSGNWSNANLVPNIANGANSDDLSPSLWVNTDGAPFTDGTTIKYTLSANPDGSTPILSSAWTPDPLAIPDGTLMAGTTYYWNAQAQGPNNYDGSAASLSSTWWSFVATDVPVTPPVGLTQLRAAAAATTPTRCGGTTLIAIRGTSAPAGTKNSSDSFIYQSNGYGNPKDPEASLVTAIKKTVSIPVYTEAIKYPASWLNPGTQTPTYINSVAAGVKALIGELNNLSGACPHTLIWLAGHSQGAQVIGEALDSNHLKSIHTAARNNLRGVALTGDPTYRPGESIDASGDGTTNGLFASFRKAHSLDGFRALNPKGKAVLDVRSYCKPGDLFCQTCWWLPGRVCMFGGGTHNSYGDSPTTSKEIAFLEPFVTGVG